MSALPPFPAFPLLLEMLYTAFLVCMQTTETFSMAQEQFFLCIIQLKPDALLGALPLGSALMPPLESLPLLRRL